MLEPLFLFRFVDPAVCRVWGTAFRATLQGDGDALVFPVSRRFHACSQRELCWRIVSSWWRSPPTSLPPVIFERDASRRLLPQDQEVEWGAFVPLEKVRSRLEAPDSSDSAAAKQVHPSDSYRSPDRLLVPPPPPAGAAPPCRSLRCSRTRGKSSPQSATTS